MRKGTAHLLPQETFVVNPGPAIRTSLGYLRLPGVRSGHIPGNLLHIASSASDLTKLLQKGFAEKCIAYGYAGEKLSCPILLCCLGIIGLQKHVNCGSLQSRELPLLVPAVKLDTRQFVRRHLIK